MNVKSCSLCRSLAPEVVSRLGSATPEAATGVLHTRKFGPPQAAQLPPGRSTDSGLPAPNTASNIRRIAPVAVAVASGTGHFRVPGLSES